MTVRFRIETFADQTGRADFDCGVESLDRYFREQVGQDIRRRVTACYVAVEAETQCIAGYYTLAASGVPLADMPDSLIKRLPRYPLVPVARMGRLAVDLRFRGSKLGAALLWDAATRAARSEMAVLGLVVDAKDATAEAFYRYHGFIALSAARQLLMPLAKIRPAG